jgi:hypothetical protein
MGFKGAVGENIARGHAPSPAVPGLLITTTQDQGGVCLPVAVASEVAAGGKAFEASRN